MADNTSAAYLDTPAATSEYARLIGMTFPPGEPGEQARDEFGRPRPPQAYEAPPIEQFGPDGSPGYDVAPGSGPASMNPAGGYQVPPGGYPPPGQYGGYPPPPPGYGPPSYPSWYPVPDQAGNYPAAAGTNRLAIGSLVASAIGLVCGIGSILGVVLGFIALNQIKNTGQAGRGLAVAGIAVGAVSFVISILAAYYISR